MDFIGLCQAFRLYVPLDCRAHSLAGLFLGLLAYRWYSNAAASVAAAFLAAFNGFFMARATFPNHFAAAAWLPALLYFQDIQSPLGLGISLALQWLSGFPPFVCVSVFLVLALASSSGRGGWQCFIKGTGLALALSAMQWVPFLELLAKSSRGMWLIPSAAFKYFLPAGQLAKELLLPQWPALSPGLQGDPAIVTYYTGEIALGLAAWGVWQGKRREKVLAMAAAAGIIFSLSWAAPLYRGLVLFRIFRFPANWLLMTTTGVGLLCACGISRLRPSWRWTAVALVAADLLLAAQFPRSAWSLPKFLENPPALAQYLAGLPQPVRIYHADLLWSAWQRTRLQDEEDYSLMRDFLAPSFGTAFGVQEVRSYQVLHLKQTDEFLARLTEAGPRSSLLKWTGASAVVTLSNAASGVRRPNLKVWLDKAPLQRVFVVNPGPKESVSILSYRAGNVRAKIDLRAPRMVVFSEAEFPGWQVTIDGKPAELARFEGVFLAVRVPPGSHEILFKFTSRTFQIGLCLTVTTMIAMGLFWLKRRS